MWSHYADKHFGMCLGFDVPDELLLKVSYETDRLEVNLEREFRVAREPSEKILTTLLTTKFSGWSYEEERRRLLNKQDVVEDKKLEFFRFDSTLQLRRVVLGTRCKLQPSEVLSALRPADKGVEVNATRIAIHDFRIVRKSVKK